MKFETKEELKKRYTDPTYSFGFNDGITEGIDETWESFAERVEFYKKYRVPMKYIKEGVITKNMYNLSLWYDYPEIVKKYLDEFKNIEDGSYNEWFFNYCFKDVIE